MTQPNNTSPNRVALPLSRRIPLAFSAFFSILSDAAFAARVQDLSRGEAPTQAPIPEPVKPVPRPMKEADPAAALQLLGLLQRDARLIDFTQENLAGFSDADIGAAARVVHEGCGKVLRDYFVIEPVRNDAEGSRITLQDGFDVAAIRLTGNVVGHAPFSGYVRHCGWRAAAVRLPHLAERHDAAILAPAEVEL